MGGNSAHLAAASDLAVGRSFPGGSLKTSFGAPFEGGVGPYGGDGADSLDHGGNKGLVHGGGIARTIDPFPTRDLVALGSALYGASQPNTLALPASLSLYQGVFTNSQSVVDP